jgi:peroxiredoxin
MGLAVGESAPPFKARDQFGQDQDNQKITGKNGTVLLFFRSADW